MYSFSACTKLSKLVLEAASKRYKHKKGIIHKVDATTRSENVIRGFSPVVLFLLPRNVIEIVQSAGLAALANAR